MTYVIAEPRVDVCDRACVEEYADENARLFAEPLPGRQEPLGSPGGATKLGVVGADTPLVASLQPRR